MNVKKKFQLIFWLTSVVCVIGFTAQVGLFFELYLRFPTRMESEITFENELRAPAFTICNFSPVKRSAVCQHCPETCGSTNTTFIAEVAKNMMKTLNVSYLKEVGFFPKDCLSSSALSFSYQYKFGNCYTATSFYNAETREEMLYNKEKMIFDCKLDIEPQENSFVYRYIGLVVAVHDRDEIPDMYNDGIYISPGRRYTIEVTKTTTTLLKAPYSSNCQTYKTKKEKNYQYQISRKYCIYKCMALKYEEICGCIPLVSRLPLIDDFSALKCSDNNSTTNEDCQMKIETDELVETCQDHCPLECKKNSFTVDVRGLVYPPYFEMQMLNKTRDQVIFESLTTGPLFIPIRLRYQSTEQAHLNLKPIFLNVELFSNIGGLMGVWLGFSFLHAPKMFFIVYTNVKRKSKKRRRQHKIFYVQRNDITESGYTQK